MMTKKLTETDVDRYRALASLPKTLKDTLRPVSLCRTYALIPRLSPQGLSLNLPSHTIAVEKGLRKKTGVIIGCRPCEPAQTKSFISGLRGRGALWAASFGGGCSKPVCQRIGNS